MRVVRSPLVLLALASIVAALFVACSLDWSARGIERQAAPEASAPTDAPSGDANDSDAGDAGDASVDCTMLESQLADAKKSARTPCTLGSNDCRTTGVTDECGCTVAVIDDAGTPSTDLFASLASQVRASCNPSCDAGGCVTIAKGAWACLQAGTPAPTCYP